MPLYGRCSSARPGRRVTAPNTRRPARALALLVLPDGDDAFRLRPATDDGLWNEMKAQGPANFASLLPATQAEGVRPDYLAGPTACVTPPRSWPRSID